MSENFGYLVPTGGGDPIPLLKRKLLIGRRGACDIALNFPNVSSRHCELELLNGYWQASDAGSTNGIKINGERSDRKFVLPGDVIAIAKHSYRIEYEADPAAPVPVEDEDIFAKGLMEKAGLSRGVESGRRPSTAKQPSPVRRSPPKSTPVKPSSAGSSKSGGDDDDVALDFLNDA